MTSIVEPKWGGFLAVGIVLAVAGTIAIVLPEISTFATGTVLGVALSAVGIVKMIQSFRIKEWGGFIWQELTGMVELVGGVLIYLNPLKGALGITLLIALVCVVQGISQIMLALRVRQQEGWYWFAVAGLIALLASASLVFKLPLTTGFEPGTIAGIALLVAGIAYIAIALTVRRST